MAFPGASRKVYLASLTGLKDSVHFYIPAAFLPGNLVRDCNRDGCPAGMGRKARKVLGLSLELIVALTMDTDCNVPYVHTLCVALLLWLPWSDAVPGCCYAVEALEAMLSRLGSMCWAYPQMKTFSEILDLLWSKPPSRRRAKKTRGQILSGLVAMMSARPSRFLLAITTCRMVNVEWNSGKKAAFTPLAFPEDIKFLTRPPDNGAEALYHRLLTRTLPTLTCVASLRADYVLQLLRTTVRRRDPQCTISVRAGCSNVARR